MRRLQILADWLRPPRFVLWGRAARDIQVGSTADQQITRCLAELARAGRNVGGGTISAPAARLLLWLGP